MPDLRDPLDELVIFTPYEDLRPGDMVVLPGQPCCKTPLLVWSRRYFRALVEPPEAYEELVVTCEAGEHRLRVSQVVRVSPLPTVTLF